MKYPPESHDDNYIFKVQIECQFGYLAHTTKKHDPLVAILELEEWPLE